MPTASGRDSTVDRNVDQEVPLGDYLPLEDECWEASVGVLWWGGGLSHWEGTGFSLHTCPQILCAYSCTAPPALAHALAHAHVCLHTPVLTALDTVQ